MTMKSVFAAALTAVVLVGATVAVRADEKEVREKLLTVERELAPLRQKAMADAEVKVAKEAMKTAAEKVEQALQAAMIKSDPKAKDLLEQRTKLQEEIAALHKAEMAPKKKAPAEKKE